MVAEAVAVIGAAATLISALAAFTQARAAKKSAEESKREIASVRLQLTAITTAIHAMQNNQQGQGQQQAINAPIHHFHGPVYMGGSATTSNTAAIATSAQVVTGLPSPAETVDVVPIQQPEPQNQPHED